MSDAPVDWYTDPVDDVAHGFATNAWMRSLCGSVRWTAALDHVDARRCTACTELAVGVQVKPVAPVRRVDRAARKAAIARAAARRRWARTS